MKAVYEMPRVSFEEFAPNMQIAAACVANTSADFNCLYGPNTETYKVLSSIVGVEGCTNQCGFIDFENKDYAGSDFFTGTYTNTTSGFEITTSDSSIGHTKNNDWVVWSNKIASITDDWKNKFAGWLYIFVSGGKYSTDNVNVASNNGRVTLSTSSKDPGAHLEFLPIFSSNPTSV